MKNKMIYWLIQSLTNLKQWWFRAPDLVKLPPLMKQLQSNQFSLIDPTFRLATYEDLGYFEDMQSKSYQGYIAWSESNFKEDWNSNPYCMYIVVEQKGEIIGLINGRIRVKNAHISHVIVLPEYQGKGIGKRLVEQWLLITKVFHSKQVTLEVRVSNVKAQQLYQLLGFTVTGRHPKYYSNDSEDALMMTWKNEES